MLLAAVGDESEGSSPESDFREDYVWVKAWHGNHRLGNYWQSSIELLKYSGRKEIYFRKIKERVGDEMSKKGVWRS